MFKTLYWMTFSLPDLNAQDYIYLLQMMNSMRNASAGNPLTMEISDDGKLQMMASAAMMLYFDSIPMHS